jgi:hypothetical protein
LLSGLRTHDLTSASTLCHSRLLPSVFIHSLPFPSTPCPAHPRSHVCARSSLCARFPAFAGARGLGTGLFAFCDHVLTFALVLWPWHPRCGLHRHSVTFTPTCWHLCSLFSLRTRAAATPAAPGSFWPYPGLRNKPPVRLQTPLLAADYRVAEPGCSQRATSSLCLVAPSGLRPSQRVIRSLGSSACSEPAILAAWLLAACHVVSAPGCPQRTVPIVTGYLSSEVLRRQWTIASGDNQRVFTSFFIIFVIFC